jgi:N-acetylglutamate synthase-like GNAT family acetyltransferase
MNQELSENVKDFLAKLPSIKNIDDQVMENASILLDENRIMGLLSFEVFENRGLIRYFIFQKQISEDDIVRLFNDVLKNASSQNINELIAIAIKKDVRDVFNSLGFTEIDHRYVFIGEEPLRTTEFDKAVIMRYTVPSGPDESEKNNGALS